MARWFMILSGVAGAAGVGFSAMAAHALQASLTAEAAEWVETAGTFLILHAPALALCALTAQRLPGKMVTTAGWLFCVGLICFSGGLLLLAFTGLRSAVTIIPVGGGLLVVAWLALGGTGLTWLQNGRDSQFTPSESDANRSNDSPGQV